LIVGPVPKHSFDAWIAALEKRHLANLSFAEVRRGLQALSSVYVERRERLASGAALDGAGKRAAFALYYGPLHFLLLREIVSALGAETGGLDQVVDLGCGTGAASAAWALGCATKPRIDGVDISGFAIQEARWTWSRLGLEGNGHRGDVATARLPGARAGILAAFTVNELGEETRETLLAGLVRSASRGARVLVVEPLSRRTSPWWPRWREAFEAAGGRADEWRFPVKPPPTQLLLARAAGLDARELTGRSLSLGSEAPARASLVGPADPSATSA
jgi:SAM-dependent methyltransferase